MPKGKKRTKKGGGKKVEEKKDEDKKEEKKVEVDEKKGTTKVEEKKGAKKTTAKKKGAKKTTSKKTAAAKVEKKKTTSKKGAVKKGAKKITIKEGVKTKEGKESSAKEEVTGKVVGKEEEKKEKVVETAEAKKKKGKRPPLTVKSYIDMIDELSLICEKEIDKKKKKKEAGIRKFQTIQKGLTDLKKKAPKLFKNGNKRGSSGNKNSGLTTTQYVVSQELAEFLQFEKNTDGKYPTVSRQNVNIAICTYCKVKPDEVRPTHVVWEYLNPGGKRNLQSTQQNKGSTIIPDDKLSKLLGYEEFKQRIASGEEFVNRKNKETKEIERVALKDDSLTYNMIQRLFTCHLSK